MKKTMKSILAAGLSLLLLMNACKKNDLTNTQDATVTAQQGARAGASSRGADADASLEPNATAEISQELFAELDKGSLIAMVPLSENAFRAVDVSTGPVIDEPYDPCAGAWAAYNAYMAANIAQFRAWANANCKPFRGGWSHPCGLCVLFQVDPTTRINCLEVAFAYNHNIELYAVANP